MKDMVWDDILSVGVDEIDEDHRKLVSIFNILNHAVADEESPHYVAAVLAELINCTVWHFSHEERLMLKHRYDRIDEHQAEHQELIKSAQELRSRALRNCSGKSCAGTSRWWTSRSSSWSVGCPSISSRPTCDWVPTFRK